MWGPPRILLLPSGVVEGELATTIHGATFPVLGFLFHLLFNAGDGWRVKGEEEAEEEIRRVVDRPPPPLACSTRTRLIP